VAIFGGAVVPLATGKLVDVSGSIGIGLLLPAACYAVIAGYGWYAGRQMGPEVVSRVG
jgi:FHS family L-fucose permease-like MFS transporter